MPAGRISEKYNLLGIPLGVADTDFENIVLVKKAKLIKRVSQLSGREYETKCYLVWPGMNLLIIALEILQI